MGSAPPMCHFTVFFTPALSRDIVVFMLLRCWGPSNSAICPGQLAGTAEELSPKSLLLGSGVPTPLALGKGSTILSQWLLGAGLQLFSSVTSCPSSISNVARVSPFEKRNQRQVRQGKEGQKSKQTWKARKPNKPANFGGRELCGLQNFEGGF